ncbi:MAG: hypothetical protein ACYC4R_08370 [Anaerolineae bacterium]
MKRSGSSLVWGLLLLVAGLVFLANNLGMLAFLHLAADLVIAGLFALGGVAFLSVFAANRAQWWALIPGMALIGIGGVIFLSQVGLAVLGGAFFLGCLALAFVLVYLMDRTRWWAVIPGGVLLTLALVAGIGENVDGFDGGALFFAGLGLTFLVVWLLPTPEGRMRWALIPAAVMLVLALIVAAQAPGLMGYLLPAAAIIGGVVLLVRALLQGQARE